MRKRERGQQDGDMRGGEIDCGLTMRDWVGCVGRISDMADKKKMR